MIYRIGPPPERLAAGRLRVTPVAPTDGTIAPNLLRRIEIRGGTAKAAGSHGNGFITANGGARLCRTGRRRCRGGPGEASE